MELVKGTQVMHVSLNDIQKDIVNAIELDSLKLPSPPIVVRLLQQLRDDPQCDIERLSNAVSNDPALAARLIRITNSPLLRRPQQVSSLPMAISMLGLEYSINLVNSLAITQLFKAHNDSIADNMDRLWKETLETAACCWVLADKFSDLKPEIALLGGLIHKIGALPILTYLDEQHCECDVSTIQLAIDALHSSIGQHILESWDFPQELADIPQEYDLPTRYVSQLDYADIVLVANLLQNIDEYEQWGSLSVFKRLGLNEDDPTHTLEHLQDEIQAAKQLFD